MPWSKHGICVIGCPTIIEVIYNGYINRDQWGITIPRTFVSIIIHLLTIYLTTVYHCKNKTGKKMINHCAVQLLTKAHVEMISWIPKFPRNQTTDHNEKSQDDSIYTLWLFNVANWEIIILKNGKSSCLSSISMGHVPWFHGYVKNIQRLYIYYMVYITWCIYILHGIYYMLNIQRAYIYIHIYYIIYISMTVIF